jgi:hypothetical protein
MPDVNKIHLFTLLMESFGLRGREERFKQVVDVVNKFYSNIYREDGNLQTCPKKASTRS